MSLGGSGNPVLDEINGLSPAARKALAGAAGVALPPTLAAPPAGTPGTLGALGAPSPFGGGGKGFRLTEDTDNSMLGPTPNPGLGMEKRMAGVQANASAAAPSMPDLKMPGTGTMPQLPTPATPMMVPRGTPAGDMNERGRLLVTGSGISQIKNPIARGGLRLLDTLGEVFTPGLESHIPGTEGYHQRLLGQAGAQEKESDAAAESGAHTAHENAATEALQNPRDKFTPLATDDGEVAFDPASGTAKALKDEAGNPLGTPDKSIPHYVAGQDGAVVAISYDPKSGQSQAHVVYQGDPKVQTDIIQREVGGKNHNILINKQTGNDLKDLGESGIKPPNLSVSTGTWQQMEDADKNPLLFNSKTKEVIAAPQAMFKVGTADKKAAANAPVQQALDYANDYQANKRFTGSGDEALQEKFFELAKPSTGFRMSQPQMDMLQNSRDWMQSAAAHARHATAGTWFSEQQRDEIVRTMNDLAKAKGLKPTGAAASADAPAGGGGGTAPKDGDRKKNSAGDDVVFHGGKWGPV